MSDSQVVLFADPLFLKHETGAHPEHPERLRAVHDRLVRSGLLSRLAAGKIVPATREQLLWTHTGEYIDHVEEFTSAGGGRIDDDTVVSGQSYNVALHAAGSACAAVDQVIDGTNSRAVCLLRPPGHHALAHTSMGFCVFNNTALAAKQALNRHGLSRILIVDWDVHHGNGTQASFYESPEVWAYSAHRSPFYPGTGSADETGTGPGLGTTFNLPLAYGISRHEYRERFESVLADAANRCRPELVIVSAGFDTHVADPVGSLGLETEDFETLTRMVVDVANQYCGGKVISLLEGGYDPIVLAESVECHIEALLKP